MTKYRCNVKGEHINFWTINAVSICFSTRIFMNTSTSPRANLRWLNIKPTS